MTVTATATQTATITASRLALLFCFCSLDVINNSHIDINTAVYVLIWHIGMSTHIILDIFMRIFGDWCLLCTNIKIIIIDTIFLLIAVVKPGRSWLLHRLLLVLLIIKLCLFVCTLLLYQYKVLWLVFLELGSYHILIHQLRMILLFLSIIRWLLL
jgi:hypothetical protein